MKNNWPAIGFSCLLLAGAAVAVRARERASRSTSIRERGRNSWPRSQPLRFRKSGHQTAVRISGTGELRYQGFAHGWPATAGPGLHRYALERQKHKVPSAYAPVLDVRAGQPDPGQSRIVIDLDKLVLTPSKPMVRTSRFFSTRQTAQAAPAALRPVRKPTQHKLNRSTYRSMPLPAWLTESRHGIRAAGHGTAGPCSRAAKSHGGGCRSDSRRYSRSEKKYTGDPISVNLKDVDLKDFFRLIHEISGLNVVLDPAVSGTVTLVLDEVPWDQALDIVLRNNGLTKEIDGNVLRIATQDTLRHEADQRRDLLKAQADAIGSGDGHARSQLCPGRYHGGHDQKVSDARGEMCSPISARTP